jgi:malate/lactate dehydrogenase
LKDSNEDIVVIGDAPVATAIVDVCRRMGIANIRAGVAEDPAGVAVVVASSVERVRQSAAKMSKCDAVVVAGTPHEPLVHAAWTASGLPRGRVIGVGTVAANALFRRLIAQRCKVAQSDVQAFVVGTVGHEIPLWSTASIATIPLPQWSVPGHAQLSVRDRTEIFVGGVKAAAQQLADATAPAAMAADPAAAAEAMAPALVEVLRAIVHDENRVLTVTSPIENYGGISGVCLALPCIVNRNGAEPPLEIALNPAEEAGLQNAAEAVRAANV